AQPARAGAGPPARDGRGRRVEERAVRLTPAAGGDDRGPGGGGLQRALVAGDLLHGNCAQRGWLVTDVSFYTTELPEYALVELARGLRPDVVHIAAAITYTLLVATAAALARGR